LIAAFKLLRAESRPVGLHIYGGLEAKQAYAQNYINRLRQLAGDDARIHFEGRFENARVAEILSGLDVTVTPSTWYENSPLAILESRAAGTPVVTAALGGMAELVRDGVDGLHFRPGDAADLARQLQRLLDEPDLLPRLRAGVARNVPRSIEDEMRQLMEIYQGLGPHARSQNVVEHASSEKRYDLPHAVVTI
jgi:glycosyltransferase involved in cell wall biosynthesis